MKNLSRLLLPSNVNSDITFEHGFYPGMTLRRLRRSMEVKQIDIIRNENCNINQAHLCNIEKGKRGLDFDVLIAYSEVLKIDYYDLLSAILKDYDLFLEKESKKIKKLLDSKNFINKSPNPFGYNSNNRV